MRKVFRKISSDFMKYNNTFLLYAFMLLSLLILSIRFVLFLVITEEPEFTEVIENVTVPAGK